jgi:hypothetical protein
MVLGTINLMSGVDSHVLSLAMRGKDIAEGRGGS